MLGSIPNAEATSAACCVASHALVEATLAEIPGLRDQRVTEGVPALPSRYLRHCDEQTVVGLRAVLAAIASHPEPRPTFTDYGVVGAPCQAGRIATAQSLAMLRTAGGVAVSPHVVPQCSLHSLAGAVSVALGMHGPNLGSSGGEHAVSEGLFTSLSLLAANESLPGIWLVVSGWTQEPPLDASGKPDCSPPKDARSGPICRALAVALTSTPSATADMGTIRQLTLHMPAALRVARPTTPCRRAADEILDVALALAAGPAASWSHTCPWGAEIRLAPHAAARDGLRAEQRASSRREAA